jgi:hypothetical protein
LHLTFPPSNFPPSFLKEKSSVFDERQKLIFQHMPASPSPVVILLVKIQGRKLKFFSLPKLAISCGDKWTFEKKIRRANLIFVFSLFLSNKHGSEKV